MNELLTKNKFNMENKDKPAFGFVDNRSNSNEYCNGVPYNGEIHYGLTKREYFAGLAMQGMLHTDIRHLEGGFYSYHKTHLIKVSIELADELLKQLESGNQ
jgi:hypothetical protein